MVKLYTSKSSTLKELEKLAEVQVHRPYLGMSGLGHSCERYLWYSFRWCYKEEISARMLRLFNRGHREEEQIIYTLNKLGTKVYKQQEEIIAVHGHVKGHIDGRAIGVIEAPKTEHLVEFKTMNDKNFKTLCKDGVKISKPVYYAQTQLYSAAFKLTRILFIAVNKNDDTWYVERIKTDTSVSEYLLNRAESIVLSEAPPEKKFKSTWFECRFCSANDICHKEKSIEENCRTCVNCDILQKGKWECSLHEKGLTTQEQRDGCKKYSMLEILIVS